MHPDDAQQQVSAETIYRTIYAHPRGLLTKVLVAALRQAKPVRGRRRTTGASAGYVPEDLRRMPAFLRQSLTCDRGSETACHRELASRLNRDIWYADPHAPWQRGSNENTSGLLRQLLPKGTDLSTLSQTALNDIARLLNGRPRKTLDWKTPEEAMSEVMAAPASAPVRTVDSSQP